MRVRINRGFRQLAALIALALMLTGGIPLTNWPVAAQGNELEGDFTVAIARLQVPTDVANGSTVVGRWRVSFRADGTYVLERLDLGVLVTGAYEVDGDTLTVTDESGLMSCSNAAAGAAGQTDVATATYSFVLDSGNLKLTPVEEGCALRRVLFATNDFTVYVACLTVETEVGVDAAPEASPRSTLDILTGLATPVTIGRDPVAQDPEIETQIDELLSQMTSCWATGDPQRFLPLLTKDFQEQFVGGTEEEQTASLASLQAAMQLPIVWERAGDVTETEDNRAQAVVRTTAADQEEFVRYLFVFEDEAWRWDGSAT